jgi:hypothetical protein
MKIDLSGKITIYLSESDINLAIEQRKDWSVREAIIQEAREEARAYIPNEDIYLELRTVRIDGSNSTEITFDLKHSRQYNRNSIRNQRAIGIPVEGRTRGRPKKKIKNKI